MSFSIVPHFREVPFMKNNESDSNIIILITEKYGNNRFSQLVATGK